MKEIEQSISKEIREWSFHNIEQPISEDSAISMCPYARKAWEDDRVSIAFKHDKSFLPVYKAIEQFDDSFDITVVVDISYESNAYDFHQRIESINCAIATGTFNDLNIWVMGSHPDDDHNAASDDSDFVQSNDISYAMIYVQRLAYLQEAANKLKHTNYYQLVFGDREPDHVFETREHFYNQLLENGYAGTYKEKGCYEKEAPYGNEGRHYG